MRSLRRDVENLSIGQDGVNITITLPNIVCQRKINKKRESYTKSYLRTL